MGILRGSVVHRYALWCTGCNGRHGKLLNKKADKLPFCAFNPMVPRSSRGRPTKSMSFIPPHCGEVFCGSFAGAG
jgi:hypothetical protein